MAENCSSSPLDGCQDTNTYTNLSTLTALLENKLTSIVEKNNEIVVLIEGCNEDNANKFQDIINLFQDIIDQGEECCDETLANLDRILSLLANVVIGEITTTTSTTINPVSTTTTTVSGVSTTTTTAGTTTTTTTISEESEGLFAVSNNEDLVCLAYPYGTFLTLHYMSPFGTGKVMYTDSYGGTPLTGYTFIRKTDSIERYSIHVTTGIVGGKLTDCES